MGEAIANRIGAGQWHAVSAGSHPKAEPHPMALTLLAEAGYDIHDFRSKSWDEFTAADADPIDIVITVCDNAADEICPIFPGSALKAHWGIADPAAIEGGGQRMAFETAYEQLERRFSALASLNLSGMSRESLANDLAAIGQLSGATRSIEDA